MITKHKFSNTKEWLQFRQKGIGGSDASVLWDQNPYKTRTQLIIDKKTEVVEKEQSAVMGLGSRMERVIIEDFVQQKYTNVETFDNEIFINDKLPSLQASLDAMAEINGEKVIIEIKFVNLFGGSNWKNAEGDWELPKTYWHQVQHYMAVMEVNKTIVVAFMQELNDVIEIEVQKEEYYGYQLQVQAVDFFEEVRTHTGILTTVVENEQKPVLETKLLELKDISLKIKQLEIRKKTIQENILDKYDTGTVFEIKAIKGIIYERQLKDNTKTRILKIV